MKRNIGPKCRSWIALSWDPELGLESINSHLSNCHLNVSLQTHTLISNSWVAESLILFIYLFDLIQQYVLVVQLMQSFVEEDNCRVYTNLGCLEGVSFSAYQGKLWQLNMGTSISQGYVGLFTKSECLVGILQDLKCYRYSLGWTRNKYFLFLPLIKSGRS